MTNKQIRKEFKFLIQNKELSNLYKFYGNSLDSLYSNRKIRSLYMDTEDFKIYQLSKLNDVGKFKYRFRTYPNTDSHIYKEIKLNTSLGKEKIVKKTNIRELNQIKYELYKDFYLRPSLYIEYERQYKKIDNKIRLTIDNKIKFTIPKNRSLLNYPVIKDFFVVEMKILNDEKIDINKYFFKNPIAFSKYDFGIETIYNKLSI